MEDKVPAECKFSEFGCEVELIGHLLMQHENGRCPFEPVNCDFNHRGCVETVSRAKKFDHVEHCSFRLVDCPIPSCKVQIVKKKLIHHLKEAHGNPDTLMSHRTLMILFLLSVLLNVIFMLVYLGLDLENENSLLAKVVNEKPLVKKKKKSLFIADFIARA